MSYLDLELKFIATICLTTVKSYKILEPCHLQLTRYLKNNQKKHFKIFKTKYTFDFRPIIALISEICSKPHFLKFPIITRSLHINILKEKN